MTAGITSLPVRASPTRRCILRSAVQFAHVHTPAGPVATSFNVANNSMLTQANKVYEAKGGAARNALEKQLFPSSSPSANADIRDQMRKTESTASAVLSARTSAQRSAVNNASRGAGHTKMTSLYTQSESFKEEHVSFIDLTDSNTQDKSQELIFLEDDDFSDFDDADLDFSVPTPLPPAPKSQQLTAKENVPPSTQSVPWSSSPLSHFQPPQAVRVVSASTESGGVTLRDSLTEENSQDAPVVIKAKKRKLPDTFTQKAQDPIGSEIEATTPAKSSRSAYWDPTASTIKEQKRQLKSQRQTLGIDEDDTATLKTAVHQAQEATLPKMSAISLSSEQQHVLDLVVNKGQSVFFTGAAGTGKSVLMRSIIAELKKKHARSPERVAVTASTGLAACNIGGITLHSFSGIGLGKEDAATLVKKVRRNPIAKKRWLQTKCLIIDEISMVDGDLFDKLSQIGRTIRNNGRPWGGIQLIITGDFFQLPPVPESGSREIKFAFEAATWNTSIDHTIGLTEVFRQRDPVFAGMLNEMRLGAISLNTVKLFKSLERPLTFDDGIDMAELYPMRHQVENSNLSRLRALPGKSEIFECIDTGDEKVRDKLLSNMMAPKSLELKVNAQVMLIKNLDEYLVNGSLGKVIGFSDERTYELSGGGGSSDTEMDERMAKAKRKLAAFSRDSDHSSAIKYPVVRFSGVDGTTRDILCQPEEWKVELPNGEVQAKRSQLPLILAWALSIHKAQGQTLERVKVDLGKIFEKGQAYVALSRATTQEGLQVRNFDKSKVMAHPRVCSFYKQLYSAEEALAKKRPAANSVVNRTDTPTTVAKAVGQPDQTRKLTSYGFYN